MISEHNEGREPTMVDVREVLAKLSEGKRDNPAVLAINAHRLMQAKNNGFPKHMYHPKLDPVVVLSEEQELRIRALGYQDNYQHRLYPRTLFRRNMDPKFELR